MNDRVEDREGQTVEEAFAEHRESQRIREAIAYVKAWTTVGDDQMLQWADSEVLDAAEKYADYLETRAYKGLPADLLAAVRRGVESGEIEGKVTRVEHDYYDHHASDGNLVKAGSYLVISVGADDDGRMK